VPGILKEFSYDMLFPFDDGDLYPGIVMCGFPDKFDIPRLYPGTLQEDSFGQ
jgi:hypothetical protein